MKFKYFVLYIVKQLSYVLSVDNIDKKCKLIFSRVRKLRAFESYDAREWNRSFCQDNFFHKEQRLRYTPNSFHAESLLHDAEENYYLYNMR